MLRDMTLGQYYQTDSVIHRMDPRVKLIGTIVYIVSLFLYKNVTAYVLAFVFLLAVIKISRVPFRFMVKGLKAVVFLLLITSVFNLFLTRGEPLFVLWKFTITREGLLNAVYIVIRLSFLIIGSSLMTLTTTPNQLTDGLERLMKPLKVFKVPVHEVAMMMSIALRFIPILMEETDKIMKAQMARGANFESGKLMEKVKAMVPLLVPLMISAFRRANDLAMAMEARCYRGGEGRTKMKPLKYHSIDYGAFGVFCVYLVSVIVLGKVFPVNFL
ncbi:MAG: energy-coupling factor transporter transmembrane protein EcfT [Lachnospiraceae bacterium]|nr:energy-coupling factor transporter transmembrane protein EcfT [Lachnospiraceae bacterium]